MALLCLNVAAQAQYQVQDHPSVSTGIAFSPLGSRVYFVGGESATGAELWRFNDNLPERLTDIWQGVRSSITGNLKQMPVVNGSVYFPALDKTNGGTILYAYSDAGYLTAIPLSPAGVVEVLDNEVVTIDDTIYFVGRDNNGYLDIYGYQPATGLIAQLTTQHGSAGQMTNYNGLLVFARTTINMGSELGVLDLKNGKSYTYDINAGNSSSFPGSFTVVDNTLYFAATTAAEGRELYSYDPLTGPVRLTDLQPGAANSVAGGVIVHYKGSLVFSAYTNSSERILYQYNLASKAGTQLGAYHGQSAILTSAAVYGGKLFMNIDTSFMFNPESLYIYDGTGLPKIASQLLGGAQYQNVYGLGVCGNKLYFTGATLPNLQGHLVVVTDSTVLGVGEQLVATGIELYPNPATTEAHISFSLRQATKLNVQLADMQGRVVYASAKQYSAGKHEITVPVSELAVGVYMYTVADADGTVLDRGRVVKE